ncbi:hypothetical protein Srot_0893 [Segniliparus rotundus DSM 44985]|uniref:Uncharacterized protein n=1 Tax=Segniliparus rotundus (strain ATCC BAA-972 / CDC 1076 / CIP 108378 / DSM 44985 / JCM 13578) TaxID=640132 RepID=D6ZE90_SEGRD|nr:hypothetical protein [Segniliparus rotundus]ADG97370.1 hypothetical protein Srot_0893 [Segniliparus rotundus DSM 44985]
MSDSPAVRPSPGWAWPLWLLMVALMLPVGAYELFIIGISAMAADGCPSSGPCDLSWVAFADATIGGGWLLAFLVATAGFIVANHKGRPALRWAGYGWATLVLTLALGLAIMSAGEKAMLDNRSSSAPTTPWTPPYRMKTTLPDEAAAAHACLEFYRQTLQKLPEGWYWSQSNPPEWPVNTSVVHPETQTSKDYPPLLSASFYLMNNNRTDPESRDITDLVRSAWLELGWEESRYPNSGDQPSRQGVTESGVEMTLYRASENRDSAWGSANCNATFRKEGEDPAVTAAFPHTITR